MKTLRYLFLLLSVIFMHHALAQVLPLSKVPEPLKPWIDWVLNDEQQFGCPFSYNQFEQKQCHWPTRLDLTLGNSKGQFVSEWQVAKESWITLPGESQYWPQRVLVNHRPMAVVSQEGRPALKLPPGYHSIQGEFDWDYIPEQLPIPENTGLIKLIINGTPISMPTIKEGVLWLKDSERGASNAAEIQDNLEIQVFRQVIDSVPLQVQTRIELDVAGHAREYKLAQALLPGFMPMQLSSPLPAHLETDGQLLVQLRPGHWQLLLLARLPQTVEQLTLPSIQNWPEAEIWTFAARPELRVLEIKGVEAIDASQTNLPDEWASFPAYRIKAGQVMQFNVLRRGNPEPEPSQLNLSRQLWLDFDGQGYSVSDRISGQMTSGWRLNALSSTQLGKVSQNDSNQLITRSATGNEGIEVRQGQLNVQADSRYTADISQFSASGWQHAFNQLNVELNLPPGWQLLAASGVDNVPESWVARWTLLDLFMVLIAALAVGKLCNIAAGFLALITLTLIWHEPDAPHWIWLHILAASALIKLLPAGRLQLIINSYRKLCAAALILMVIPFVIYQVRLGLYPQLARPWQEIQSVAQPYADALNATSNVPAAAPMVGGVVAPARMLAKKMETRAYANVAEQKAKLDADANVQTGPGLPQWQWQRIHLSWNGTVDSQQQVKLWYASPKISMLLNFLRVLLLGLLIPAIFEQWNVLRKLPLFHMGKSLSVLLFVLLTAPIDKAQAEFPAQPVLEELKNRLLAAPDCLPQCADIATLEIAINPTQLSLNLQIDAQEAVMLPLPAQQQQWLPEQVRLDGTATIALERDADGQLWLQIAPGQHQLNMQGAAPSQEKFTLSLPLLPHKVSVKQNGWEVTGVHEHGIADQQLQFSRINHVVDAEVAKFTPETLPPFFRIERNLQLGIDWRVHTQVLRMTPANAAALLQVPLLPGESVLTAGLRTENRNAVINMDAQQTEAAWDSVLEKVPQLDLIAPQTTQWHEVWRLDVSPLWHMQTDGLAPVHPGQQTSWQPEWQPWPGEKISLAITRPEAIAGQTLTLEHSSLNLVPGQRITNATLTLDLKSSRGGQHAVTLPEGAELQTVSIDGTMQPLRLQEGKLTLPVKPGAQTWQLNWRQTQALRNVFTSPAINVGLNNVNHDIKIHFAQDRWVLMTFGPRLGPAVLFWGMLLVMGLLSLLLAKANFAPLKSWHWFALLLGLSQIPLELALIVIAWFILLGTKSRWTAQQPGLATNETLDINQYQQQKRSTYLYNSRQILLVILTFTAAACLFMAVEKGLLGNPEMQISGNLSSAYELLWYQDRSSADLPVAQVISVPLWVYRGLMLLWSLWLALALLKWLQWGWQCFAAQGVWWKPVAKI